MGIQGLSKLIFQRAPSAVREDELKNYFGRKIAIDASMSIYQFIIALKGFENGQGVELANEQGEVTSHLNGLWARTLRMVDDGLKPIYVFDGKAPDMKKGELEERRKKAQAAEEQFKAAQEAGNDEEMEKLSKRTVRVTRDQIEDCKRLLTLMGVPVVQAASEAEAQCAELVKGGKAWAVATEDMDALTFGAPRLLRHLGYSGGKDKKPVMEYNLQRVLDDMQITMPSFIDLCVLLGCDYCSKVSGIGPQKAFDGIQAHKDIETFLSSIDKSKFLVPDDFHFAAARELFVNPPVVPAAECVVEWKEPDAEGLLKFMVEEKLFNRDRIDKGIARLKAAAQKKQQVRIDDFFKPVPRTVQPLSLNVGKKRGKSPEKKKGGAAAGGGASGKLANKGGAHKKAVKKN